MRCARGWLLVTLGACGGEPVTQLIVSVQADTAIAARMDAVVFEIEGPSGAREEIEQPYGSESNPSLPLELTLVPASSTSALGPIRIGVEARSGGSPLVRQDRVVSMERRATTRLVVRLSTLCMNAECAAGDTCLDGACVPANVAPDAGVPPPDSTAPPLDMLDPDERVADLSDEENELLCRGAVGVYGRIFGGDGRFCLLIALMSPGVGPAECAASVESCVSSFPIVPPADLESQCATGSMAYPDCTATVGEVQACWDSVGAILAVYEDKSCEDAGSFDPPSLDTPPACESLPEGCSDLSFL